MVWCLRSHTVPHQYVKSTKLFSLSFAYDVPMLYVQHLLAPHSERCWKLISLQKLTYLSYLVSPGIFSVVLTPVMSLLYWLMVCLLFCMMHLRVSYKGATVAVVTLSPPTSEIGVWIPAWPQEARLVVGCRWSAVYSTEPWPTVCTGFLCP